MAVKIFWGTILREIRRSYMLSQEDLARILHISRQSYSFLECGRRQPTVEEIAILSEIYNEDLYRYAIKCMSVEMVAEQQEFKASLPDKLPIQEESFFHPISESQVIPLKRGRPPKNDTNGPKKKTADSP